MIGGGFVVLFATALVVVGVNAYLSRKTPATAPPTRTPTPPAEFMAFLDHDPPITLTSAFATDPLNPAVTLRGNSPQAILGGGELELSGTSPRVYVNRDQGWYNTEATVYVNAAWDPGATASSAGIAYATRSNHHDYESDPCNAATQYLKLRFSGDISSQTELYHDPGSGDTIYAPSTLVSGAYDPAADLQGKWLGVRFRVLDDEETEGAVRLQVFLDKTDGLDGGTWVLAFDHLETGAQAIGYDSSGDATDQDLPAEFPCTYANVPEGKNSWDAPLLQSGKSSFFRIDNPAVVRFKEMSIRLI